jgi:hypothetical protein
MKAIASLSAFDRSFVSFGVPEAAFTHARVVVFTGISCAYDSLTFTDPAS